MSKTTLRALVLALFCVFSTTAFSTEININTASAEQLSQLKGIGPAKAQAIVAYREQHGPFASIEQITEVKGIGNATLNKNRDLMLVTSPQEKAE